MLLLTRLAARGVRRILSVEVSLYSHSSYHASGGGVRT